MDTASIVEFVKGLSSAGVFSFIVMVTNGCHSLLCAASAKLSLPPFPETREAKNLTSNHILFSGDAGRGVGLGRVVHSLCGHV